ncbi:MAG TPA: hypothetical protein VHM90_16390 [Phycisphaerae bacterium]|nr:hypothetical protein [Phycisphaerae bacterium]
MTCNPYGVDLSHTRTPRTGKILLVLAGDSTATPHRPLPRQAAILFENLL